MQKIQLYIEGQRVDLFDDESVVLTQTIQNVKDVQKVFTDYSKTFTLPATKENTAKSSRATDFKPVLAVPNRMPGTASKSLGNDKLTAIYLSKQQFSAATATFTQHRDIA